MASKTIPAGGAGETTIDFGGLNPKQKLFCQARTRYIAYGGARGGGKTHVLRLKAVMGALNYPGIRILIIRREYPELEQTVIIPLRKLIPGVLAAYNGTRPKAPSSIPKGPTPQGRWMCRRRILRGGTSPRRRPPPWGRRQSRTALSL